MKIISRYISYILVFSIIIVSSTLYIEYISYHKVIEKTRDIQLLSIKSNIDIEHFKLIYHRAKDSDKRLLSSSTADLVNNNNNNNNKYNKTLNQYDVILNTNNYKDYVKYVKNKSVKIDSIKTCMSNMPGLELYEDYLKEEQLEASDKFLAFLDNSQNLEFKEYLKDICRYNNSMFYFLLK